MCSSNHVRENIRYLPTCTAYALLITQQYRNELSNLLETRYNLSVFWGEAQIGFHLWNVYMLFTLFTCPTPLKTEKGQDRLTRKLRRLLHLLFPHLWERPPTIWTVGTAVYCWLLRRAGQDQSANARTVAAASCLQDFFLRTLKIIQYKLSTASLSVPEQVGNSLNIYQ